MKDKNLLDDIKNKSLNDLTELANNIIEKLENEKNLELLINDYQKLIKLNNLIERKFKNTSREISQETKDKINLHYFFLRNKFQMNKMKNNDEEL